MTFDARAGERAGAGGAAPNAPILVNVFLPGGCDLLSTLTPLWRAGPLNDLRRTLGDERRRRRSASSGLGLHPSLSDGRQRRRARPVRGGQDRLPARHRLREPRPLALQLAQLLGDRDRQPARRPGLAGALARRRRDPGQPAAGPVARRRAVAHPAHAGRAGRIAEQPARRAAAASRARGARVRTKAAQAWGRLADAASSSRPGPAASAKAARLARTVADEASRPTQPRATGPTRSRRRSRTRRRTTSG